MRFEVLPVLDTMISLYQQPADLKRFKSYLSIIQGETKGDMSVPVANFNPMAKQAFIDKLHELKLLNAEEIIKTILDQLNASLVKSELQINDSIFNVCINLADDLKGGWTNHYMTDYNSKFKINPLMKRNFCVPVFWVSEDFDEAMIIKRVLQYLYRTIYRSTYQQPETLEEHILQEKFVQKSIGRSENSNVEINTVMNLFYIQHRHTTALPVIINYLYGDAAAIELGYNPSGLTGFLHK